MAEQTPQDQLPGYSLQQVAELSGLGMNQIRLWERRHQLVESRRGRQGNRLYSMADVDILRYAWRETQKGVPIEDVAEHVRQDRDAVLRSLRSGGRIASPRIIAADSRRLPNYDLMLHALSSGDPLKFERLLIQAQAGKNFAESLRSVDLPLLARIGEMSARKQLDSANSYLAAAIIRRRILSHVQALGLPRGARSVILACAPEDYHELGLLNCMLELVQQHIPTLYLGPGVPLKEIRYYCDKLQPLAVLISMMAPLSDATAEGIASFLADLNQRVPAGIGGFEAERRQELFAAHGLICFRSFEAVLDWEALQNP